MSTIVLDKISFSYPTHQVLRGISLHIGAGECACLVGSNGCGKTTLLHWITSGQPPADTQASGAISRDRAIGYVPQRLPRPGDPGFSPETWQNGIGELGRGILHPAFWNTPIE
ncbi:ATP-binding cassette domain-containing protein [Mobiluncus mulieris]|uniref:ATP-binding cassette domain-containing protein n=1 Tax=Mobiluncus mulieris TaxID=2052 RepID=A0A7Y0UT65_9ACTO|nr:ATP-binding cassette domain-containing protein [Mobiluncus mulieris]MCV0009859.1 ATP-binding cassette domain-containing protein [Mobiluncus mulieris]NMX03286.1 ATP-binding cassette domain-containing protein [Mobiluncus mulieris]NMX11704.1 ATP-binding cassette domain-containing protein [Mobiluncus mulieris]